MGHIQPFLFRLTWSFLPNQIDHQLPKLKIAFSAIKGLTQVKKAFVSANHFSKKTKNYFMHIGLEFEI